MGNPRLISRQGNAVGGGHSLFFFSALRGTSNREFDLTTHLSVNDVTVDSIAHPSMLKLHLKASKTGEEST